MTKQQSLLILGGGIAGLAAADEAARFGVEVTLVEREGRTGGLLSTDRRGGFSFDRGGHRFITAVPWVLERVRDRVGDRFLVRERNSFVLWDDTRIKYPLEFGDLLARLGPGENLRAFGSYLAATPRRWWRRQERTLAEWLERRFGRYLYRRVFAGYSEKLWGMPPEEIAAEWAPQRISIPSLGGYLRELLWPSRRPARTYAKQYLYPRTGIGEIPERFEASAREHGAKVRTGTKLVSLAPVAEGWRVGLETVAHDGRPAVKSVEVFAGVIVTVPLEVALLSWEGRPYPVPELEQRSLRFLNLGFDRPVPLDATWLYQPDPKCRFTRIQIPAARGPEMVPPGSGSIQLEEPWNADDRSTLDDRFAEARALLAPKGLWPGEPSVTFESHAEFAYPIYRPHARERARDAIAWIESHPGIAVAGRQGRFEYIFLDRALAQGVNAVRRVLGRAELEEKVDDPSNRPLPVESQSIAHRHG